MADRSILNAENVSFRSGSETGGRSQYHISPVESAIYNHFLVQRQLPPLEVPKRPFGVDYRTAHPAWHTPPNYDECRLLTEFYEQNSRAYNDSLTSEAASPAIVVKSGASEYPTPEDSAPAYSPPENEAPKETVDDEATEDEHEAVPATAAPVAMPDNSTITTTTATDDLFEPRCMYEGEGKVCRENIGKKEYLRKVVSHIFGRNKTCTGLIPEERWITFCRKHYQRCRYHVENWALKQIELLFLTLDSLEDWGGIESFRLTLRKRESDRKRTTSADNVPASRRRTAGRLSSNAATSPPSSDQPAPDTPIKYTATGRRIRSPVNVASPVPKFLQDLVGQNKTFDEVRLILEEIRAYVRHEFDENNKEVAFPDIELLPNFTKAVLREKGIPCGSLSENNHSRRRRARQPRQPVALANTPGRAHPYAPGAKF